MWNNPTQHMEDFLTVQLSTFTAMNISEDRKLKQDYLLSCVPRYFVAVFYRQFHIVIEYVGDKETNSFF
jgi:hypothetical protein